MMFLNIADLAPLLAHPCNAAAPQTKAPTRFEDLLPAADWAKLAPAIQTRFAGDITKGQTRLYAGRILTTHLPFWGKVLAHLLIPFGAPLPLHETAGGAAAIVAVTAEPGQHGDHAQVWSRHYCADKGFPQTILSTKRFAGPTGLEERLGPGLGQCIGISLKLETEADALHFISARYFLWLFGARIWLPKWLEPGRMVVSHELVGPRQFIFRLKLTHPILGVIIEQACLFNDTTEA
jgi:Domain of unknown function (DUF4166)